MPTLHPYTLPSRVKASRTRLNLSKSMVAPNADRKESTGIQQSIKIIADIIVNMNIVARIKFNCILKN